MFRTIVHILLVLALSVLIGAILFFGAGVASVLFQPGLLPSRTLAGAVNGVVLHRLNVIAGVCAAIIPIALGYLAFTSPRGADKFSFGISILLLIVVLYLGLKLLPEVNALRLEIGDFDHILAVKEPLREQFQGLHKQYSRLMQGVLLASVGLMIAHVARLALGSIRGSRIAAESRAKESQGQESVKGRTGGQAEKRIGDVENRGIGEKEKKGGGEDARGKTATDVENRGRTKGA